MVWYLARSAIHPTSYKDASFVETYCRMLGGVGEQKVNMVVKLRFVNLDVKLW